MGSGEEWANDGKGGGWCSIAVAGIASAVALVGFGLYVVAVDVVQALS